MLVLEKKSDGEAPKWQCPCMKPMVKTREGRILPSTMLPVHYTLPSNPLEAYGNIKSENRIS